VTTRARIEEELLSTALAEAAPLQIVEAPRGAGKSSLLRSLHRRLRAAGERCALVEMDRLCAGPAIVALHLPRLAARALDGSAATTDAMSSRAAPPAADLLDAIETERARRKPDHALLLDLALSYPGAAAAENGVRLVLLLDELGEAACLSRHAGLKTWPSVLARRLTGSPHLSVVATVDPASRPAPLISVLADHAAATGRGLARVTLPPLDSTEVTGVLERFGCPPGAPGADIDLWLEATHGHPAYVEILARRVAGGSDLAGAVAAEISPPYGALYQECRFDYHHLVERSRGHAAVRSILQLLASEEGANLSRIARHLGISLPTAIDYLSWLLEVGLIQREGRGYLFADPLLRLWITLNGPEPPELTSEVLSFLSRPRRAAIAPVPGREAVPAPARRPAAPPAASERYRSDPNERLMEID